MHAESRIGHASLEDRLDDAEILEDLQGARLNPLSTRAAEWTFSSVNQTKGDGPAGKFDGECQAGGTGANDEYLCFVHRTTSLVVQCTNVKTIPTQPRYDCCGGPGHSRR